MSLFSNKQEGLMRAFFRKYEWIHLTLGTLGNLTFFIGSIFFLWEFTKLAGIWLFIIGAFFMLIGSIGSALVKHVNHKQRHAEA